MRLGTDRRGTAVRSEPVPGGTMGRKILRFALASGAAILALSATFGVAASLNAASDTVGAGKATVARCDADGIVASPTWSSGNVSAVVLSGVAANCAGASTSVTVSNGPTVGSGSATVPAGGGSFSVSISPLVSATASLGLSVVIA